MSNLCIVLCGISIFTILGMGNTFSSIPKTYKIPKKDRIDLAMMQEKLMIKNPLTGKVDRSSLVNAYQNLDQHKSKFSTSIKWDERGPDNVAGRVRAFLYDHSSVNTKRVFAAGVSGGLWISNNIDAIDPNWNQVDDFLGNLSICSIAQHPINGSILYFGTGEGYFEENATPGAGMWKSSDNGNNWTHLASTSSYQYIRDILVSPSGIIMASTEAGLIRSTNQGASWTKVLSTSNGSSSNQANDLKISTDGTLYASFGIFSQGEVFRSSNDGLTWQKISTNIVNSKSRRVELAVSNASASVIYALVSDDSGICSHIYKSSNKGQNWIQKSLPTALGMSNFARTQAWYNLSAAVSPVNDDHIIVGGIDLHLSTNGGSSWQQISHWSGLGGKDYVHADQHSLHFDPNQNNKIVVTNDGGLYTCNDIYTQKPLYTSKNKGLNITQFYGVAAHPDANSNYFLAGAQDNGTQKFSQSAINTTSEATGGDGAYCYIDANQAHIQIASYVGNNYFVSTDGGNQFTPVSLNNDGFFANPTYYDSHRNILYASTVAGKLLRWTAPENKTNSYQEITVLNMNGQRITKIKPSTTTPDKLFIGTDDGDVYIVTQAHQSSQIVATKIREASNLYVSDIVIDPNDDEHLVIAYSNYGVNHLFESFNNGLIWNNIDGNLPDIPVRTMLFHPDNSDKLIIGTDLGIWMTDNVNSSATSWYTANDGLANVRVDMLSMRTSDRLLMAATHGRGLFTSHSLASVTGSLGEQNITITENGQLNLSGTCPIQYKDITIDVNVQGALQSSSAVNVTVAGGSASVGADFQVVTPNISFFSGEKTKQITLRIIDDAIEESTESIKLLLQSSAIDFGSNNVIDVMIADDDADPSSGGGQSTTIGMGNTKTDKYPLSAYYEDEKTQILIRASELTALGLQAGPISKLSFNVSDKNSDIPFTSLNIKSLQTSINAFGLASDPFYTTNSTHYSGNYTTKVGWNDMSLTSPIQWDGSSNIILEMCYNNNSWSDSDELQCSDVGYNAVKYKRVDASVGCNLSSSNAISTIRPNIKLGTTGNINLSEQLLSISTNLDPLGVAHVYDDQGNIIMSIKNLSASSISCLDISLDNIGTAVQSVSWMGANNYVSDRQFYIESDQDFPYEITLYYSTDQLASFIKVMDELSIVKSEKRIGEMSNGDPYISAAGNTVVTQSLGNNLVSFTTQFTGFSGFALYEERLGTVPLELLSLDVLEYDSYHEVIWHTTQESNLERYFIERSFDGSSFVAIGTTPSLNKKQDHFYRYIDSDLEEDKSKYFYRLGIEDINGSLEYSDIVKVERSIDKEPEINIVPNPYRESTSIQLPHPSSSYHMLQLIDIHGRVIRDLLQNQLATTNITLSGLEPGTYFLQYIDQNHKTGSLQLVCI